MLNLTQIITFLKKHKESGVWLEGGSFKLHEDVSDGHSTSHAISSSAFTFLYSLKILSPNDYMGFKGWRTFPLNSKMLHHFSITELEQSFKAFQLELKNRLRSDRAELTKLLTIKPVSGLKLYQESLRSSGVNFDFISAGRSRSGFNLSRFKVSNQTFNYGAWKSDYKRIPGFIQKRIADIDHKITLDQVNEYVSINEYERAPLPVDIQAKLNSLQF